MNTCSYCGAEYADEVIECPVDGTRMVEDPVSPAAEVVIVSFKRRIALWAVAWGVAAVIMAIGAQSWVGLWVFPIFTPLGFLTGMILHSADPGNGELVFCIGSGWLYYAGLTTWGLRSGRRGSFYSAFVILCLSLLLNCVGWQAMSASWKMYKGGRVTMHDTEPPLRAADASRSGLILVL
jgi:hypothetical protein